MPRNRKPKPNAPERKLTAYIVDSSGTDAEIEARCAEHVEGWAEMGKKSKADTIRLMRHFATLPQAVRMTVEQDESGNKTIGIPEKDNVTLHSLRLVEAFASTSAELVNDRVSDLATYARSGPKGGLAPDSDALSAALAFVHGGKPTDPVQSTLLVQMAATHDAALRALGASARSEYINQAQMFGNLAAKLLNIYTRQAEVLAKLQRGGEQVIRHIHIDNRGGQALVAEQVVTGGANAESREQSYEQGALGPALLGEDPLGNIVPMPGREGEEPMPVARGSARHRGS